MNETEATSMTNFIADRDVDEIESPSNNEEEEKRQHRNHNPDELQSTAAVLSLVIVIMISVFCLLKWYISMSQTVIIDKYQLTQFQIFLILYSYYHTTHQVIKKFLQNIENQRKHNIFIDLFFISIQWKKFFMETYLEKTKKLLIYLFILHFPMSALWIKVGNLHYLIILQKKSLIKSFISSKNHFIPINGLTKLISYTLKNMLSHFLTYKKQNEASFNVCWAHRHNYEIFNQQVLQLRSFLQS